MHLFCTYFALVLHLFYVYICTINLGVKKMTVSDMVKALGTPEYVAFSLGVSRRTIFYWMSSNQINRGNRLDFLKMLKKAGYKMTLKDLNDLQPTKEEVIK